MAATTLLQVVGCGIALYQFDEFTFLILSSLTGTIAMANARNGLLDKLCTYRDSSITRGYMRLNTGAITLEALKAPVAGA